MTEIMIADYESITGNVVEGIFGTPVGGTARIRKPDGSKEDRKTGWKDGITIIPTTEDKTQSLA